MPGAATSSVGLAASHWVAVGLIWTRPPDASGGLLPHVVHGATDMKDPAKKSPPTAAEEKLDEEIEESFPASDPPANTPTSAGGPERPKAKRTKKGKSGRRG